MESTKSIDVRRNLKNSKFDLIFRAVIVWPVMIACLFTIFTVLFMHKMFFMPNGWQLFGTIGLAGGLQEKRWHNTIGYTTVAIFTIAGIALGIWADHGI